MNYRSKTANALSKLFLLVWLLGDLTSLAGQSLVFLSRLERLQDTSRNINLVKLSGGMITSIAPSAIALSAYLCVADSILILQCWYYTSFKKRNRPAESFLPAAHEDAIANSCETDNLIRDDDEVTSPTGRSTELSAVHSPKARTWIFNTGFISCVYIVGFLAWLVSRSSDSESDLPHSNDGNADTWTSRLGLTLGYIGAGCYLW